MSVAPRPSPGWYRDPSARHAWRYWNGEIWTDYVASDGRTTLDPVPDWVRREAAQAHPEPTLPARAALYALAGMVVAVALDFALSFIGHLIHPGSLPVVLGFGQIGLWSGLIGTCVFVSRRLGTGRFVEDFGWRFRRADILMGFAMSLGGRFAAGLAAAPFLSNPRFRGSNSGVVVKVSHDAIGFVVIGLIACVGAPLVEELFFRGLVQRALASKFGGGPAIVLQAALFASAHVNPYLGLGNVSVVVAIGTLGLVLGAIARHARRLGPSTWTHAFFNLTSTLLILAASR